MPGEFSVITIMAVYIPTQANANVAFELSVNNTYPDGVVMVAGDFNHVNFKNILPKCNKNLTIPTR